MDGNGSLGQAWTRKFLAGLSRLENGLAVDFERGQGSTGEVTLLLFCRLRVGRAFDGGWRGVMIILADGGG